MGRIMTSVSVENLANPDQRIRCDALVDTGASHVVLPSAWRDRLGELEELDTVELELANQQAIEGVICGPVRIQIEGFRPVYNAVWGQVIHRAAQGLGSRPDFHQIEGGLVFCLHDKWPDRLNSALHSLRIRVQGARPISGP